MAEGFGWTEEGVRVGTVAYLFAPNSILLVSEGERHVGDMLDGIHIMQRCCWCGVDLAVDGKGDVAEVEGWGASFGRGGVEVFGRLQEPEEGNNDEVDGVGVEHSINGVVDVQGVDEGLQDGDVGWVGSSGRFIFVAEGLEESSE